MTLTKADLVDSIYEKIGFSKKEAADLVELIFDTIKDQLAAGEKIKISGFGNFVVREKKPRMGRNPQTGQSIEISARRVLTFKPSQVLRAEVNSSLEGKPIEPNSPRHRSDEEDDL
jgi:integration host factor subunit alpha